jgi:hypothetical protein
MAEQLRLVFLLPRLNAGLSPAAVRGGGERELLAGRSFVAACPGCRTISHVVGHRVDV